MTGELLQRWRALAGDRMDALGEALIGAWAEPQRAYHNQSHLLWLLQEADRRAGAIVDPVFVGYAIWFHDAVYEPGRPDNEARSAAWARAALGANPDLAMRVARVIDMTKNHGAGEAAGDAALFLDMDIAILGAPFPSYRVYAAGIRAEYPHIDDAAFAAGRGAFLEAQLQQARSFRTDLYESEIGDRARANMRWEREEMRNRRMIKS